MDDPLHWPAPFATARGQWLILPVNEGIAYPVDDPSLPEMYYTFTAVTACAWPGMADRRPAGMMTIVETPDDAARAACRGARACSAVARMGTAEGAVRLCAAASARCSSTTAATWPCASAIGEHAKQTGLLKTLAEKRKRIPTWICWSARSTSGAGSRTPWPFAAKCRRRHPPHPVEQRCRRPGQICAGSTPWACSPAATTSIRT